MTEQTPTNYDKWRYSIYSGCIFIILSLPITYKYMSYIYRGITDKKGCPTSLGVIIHAIVFILIIRLMMNYKV